MPERVEFLIRQQFLKEVIEGRELSGVDLSARRDEFSKYGSLGKKASFKKSKALTQRPKKSQPRSASESSKSDQESSKSDQESSSIDSSDSSHSSSES